MTLIAEAWAKVNLSLRVVGEREDGYHRLSSIFAKVNLSDTLSITATDDPHISIFCSDPSLPADNQNLAARAAWALKERTGAKGGARIDIVKRIPVAAGLGGGSADAGAVLAALNGLWGLGLSPLELAGIGLTLGADVPFFLNGAMAHVEGIGESITPLRPRRPLHLLLANPGFPISAAEAYRGSSFDFGPAEDKEGMIAAAVEGDAKRLVKYVVNDLEPWAVGRFPALGKLKSALERTDPKPLAVAMSGSGPTFFALHATAEGMESAGAQAMGAAPFVYPAMTMV
jgi:4-diphosphocytidyl-2-C-methyl-D-erythritol kinase